MKKWRVLLIALMVAVVWVSGCNSDTQPQQRPEDQAESKSEEEMTFTLYYADQEIMDLITEERTVTVPADKHPVQAALEELGRSPANPDAIVMFPAETEVKNVTVTDDLITIDFNSNLQNNFYGGSSSEALLLNGIVNTVTDIEGYADHKIQILIEGEKVETIGGHIAVDEPLERQN